MTKEVLYINEGGVLDDVFFFSRGDALHRKKYRGTARACQCGRRLWPESGGISALQLMQANAITAANAPVLSDSDYRLSL